MAIQYTKNEERLNVWSHAAGIAMGVVCGALLLWWTFSEGDGWARLGVVLYLIGMIGSYTASTIYHAVPMRWPSRRVWRKFDHAAIYWHIAGSYSPVTLVALRQQGYWGWSLFGFVWLCALVGTVLSFIKLRDHSHLETICYCGMGLSVLVCFKPLIESVHTAAVVWIVTEGVCYLTGALFYSFNKKKYMHSVFHFFVLAGSVCHLVAVWDILMQYL